jgi:hypothetical protein
MKTKLKVTLATKTGGHLECYIEVPNELLETGADIFRTGLEEFYQRQAGVEVISVSKMEVIHSELGEANACEKMDMKRVMEIIRKVTDRNIA